MSFDLDVERLRMDVSEPTAGAEDGPAKRRPRPGKGERYLAGPIPWSWITRAAQAGGRALEVGLVLWHLSKLRRTATVKLNLSSVAQEFGINRSTASRGLERLQAAGLVEVQRGDGRCPVVTLVGAPGPI